MKKQWVMGLILMCLFVNPAVTFAKLDSDKSEAVLKHLTDEEQSRQLTELARSMTNLERRMERIEDRFEKLDHDLKELKRKV